MKMNIVIKDQENILTVSDEELVLISKYIRLGLRVAINGKNRTKMIELSNHLDEIETEKGLGWPK